MNKDVKEFKELMSRYYAYQDKIEKLICEKDYTYHLMSGLHSPSFDGSVVSTNPTLKEEKRLKLSEKIARIDNDLSRLKATYRYLNDVLELMPNQYKSICIRIFAMGKSYESVANDYGYEKSWFFRKVDKAIQSALALYNNE